MAKDKEGVECFTIILAIIMGLFVVPIELFAVADLISNDKDDE